MKRLALIPARGGSKRIPKKNVKPFCGKPIIQYPIEAAIKSGLFSEVVVLTDDQEIAEVAKSAGAHIPYFRSAEVSTDQATVRDVVLEYFDKKPEARTGYDQFCLMLPTAPFVTAETLIQSGELLTNPDVEGVMPIMKFEYPIQRALRVKDGFVSMISPENALIMTQDLPASYHDAGQFCFLKTAAFLEQNTFFLRKMGPIVLSPFQGQDIDTLEDWELAEFKYQRYLSRKAFPFKG